MRPQLLSRRLTLAAIWTLGIWGLVLTIWPLQPFWIDEWRFIFNLKFLDWTHLWGPLRYTQQCPRLYLALVKVLNAPFWYSYATLRLPALILSLASMLLAWRLMQRIYSRRDDWLAPLFVLIIISSQTFTTYLVQTKHYEAEIFLALVALWQCLELEAICLDRMTHGRYALLCGSLAIAPFFSYTYPVAIAPALLLAGVQALKSREKLRRLLFPLTLAVAGIAAFYLTDVRQLMHDESMHRYWAYRMATGGLTQRLENLWYFFAALGPGAVFEVIFGVLGVGAFVIGALRVSGKVARTVDNPGRWIDAYVILLILLVIVLSASGQLPAGEAKFSAFCVPALGMMIVSFLQWLRLRRSRGAAAIGILLFGDLSGNIISIIYNFHTGPEYMQRMRIYGATQSAITRAQAMKVPILVTPAIAWPDEIVHKVPFLENMTADAILKTWPAYDARHSLPVYAVPDTCTGVGQFHNLFREAIMGNGAHYRIINGQ